VVVSGRRIAMRVLHVLGTLACCLAVLALLWGSASLAGEGAISEEVAATAYALAAKAIGISLGAEKPTVSRPEARISERATGVGSVRKVQSPHLSVDVDAHSGKIVRVLNEKAWHKSYAKAETARQEGKGAVPRRSPKHVIEAAENYVRSLGQSPTPEVKLRIMEFDAKGDCWNLGWVRYVNGYVFDEEAIGMSIDDQTGGLIHYNNSVTDIACTTDVSVSKEKARAIARGRVSIIQASLLGGGSYEANEPEDPVLWIVYVNRIPNGEKAEPSARPQPLLPLRARLVYDFRYEFRYTGNEMVHRSVPPLNVWVDAATGEVVEGAYVPGRAA
jgi:hypothetical protein